MPSEQAEHEAYQPPETISSGSVMSEVSHHTIFKTSQQRAVLYTQKLPHVPDTPV